MKSLWVGVLCVSLTGNSMAGVSTWFVATNSPSDGPGTAWSNAFHTIQGAVDAANNGDTVRVTNGVYYLTTEITVSEAITVESVNGHDVTTIDGQNTCRGFNLGSSACTIRGFTVTGGRATAVSPGDKGGGIHCSSVAPVIANCTLSGNLALRGGGIRLGTLNRCTLSDNEALPYDGGGSFQSTLTNCTLSGNLAGRSGGGSFEGVLNNCTIVSNSAADGGGSYSGTLKNCIIWNNTAPTAANWTNSTISYSCTTPYPGGIDNINVDPRFRNASDANYHLVPGSPCIDAGTDLGLTDDLDGNPRPVDGNLDSITGCDMGAYEYTPSLYDTDGDGRTDGDEVAMGWSPVFDEAPAIHYGESNVTGDPATFHLYTSNSITDLDMGYMMIQASNGWMRLQLELRQCTNLTDGVWASAGDAVEWLEPAPDGKAFYRVRGTP